MIGIEDVIYIKNEMRKVPGGGSIIIINDTYSQYEDETVTVSVGTYSKTAVIEDGTATIKGFTETGTVTVSVSDFTTTFNIDKYSKYETNVGNNPHGGFSYTDWLSSISESASGYSSLDDVLADEEMVRELFSRHASVDYLVSVSSANEIETIINNDYCAKWINLRDYALDTLYADSIIAALMDEADKYFYGEWALMPQVPKMTSNTTPFGTASASSEATDAGSSNGKAWNAFDGNDDSTFWFPYAGQNTGWLQYNFVNPVIITRFEIKQQLNSAHVKTFTIQGSNDGNSWTDVFTGELPNIENENMISVDFSNSNSYSYYRFLIVDNHVSGDRPVIRTLQFYTWALKGNIPVMTSDTAPYGEAFMTNENYSSAFAPFDNNPTTCANDKENSPNNVYLYYKFTNPICAKKVYLDQARCLTGDIVASNDGTNWTVLDEFTGSSSRTVASDIDITNNNSYYLYYGIKVKTSSGGGANSKLLCYTLQFYGRELKRLTPSMTSNTQPYGEASASAFSPSYPPYKAFQDILWVTGNRQYPQWIKYHFIKPEFITSCMLNIYDNVTNTNLKIEGSNDDTNWVTLHGNITLQDGISVLYVEPITNYQYVRITINSQTLPGSDYSAGQLRSVRFYGLDYYEAEWDVTHPIHYLFDHGVELDTITGGTKGNNALTLTAVGTAVATINTTNYTAMGGKVGMNASGTNNLKCGTSTSTFSSSNMSYGNGIDIANVNGSNEVGVQQSAQGTFDMEEIWLA